MIYSYSNMFVTRRFLRVFLIFILCVIVYQFTFRNNYHIPRKYKIQENNEVYEVGHTIKTDGCEIPGLSTYDSDVANALKDHQHHEKCSGPKYMLADANNTHIWLIKNNIRKYLQKEPVSNDTNFHCCYYSGIQRKEEKHRDCIMFTDTVKVSERSEFAEVNCFIGKQKHFNGHFVFAPQKNITSPNKDDNKVPLKENDTKYNVIVVGISSMSRLNFIRTMPNTFALMNKLKALELLGYSKVFGHDTFSNTVPLLTGMRPQSLREVCWPEMNPADSCPYIWDMFKRRGYYTAFAEDTAQRGIFNHFKEGFRRPHTDYYLFPFLDYIENHFGSSGNAFCINQKYSYEVLLDYIYQLTRSLKHKQLFGLFWENSLSHESIASTTILDSHYEKLFKRLNDSNYLSDTVVFFLSDQGLLKGQIMNYRGQLESRLPFAYILLPESFQQRYSYAYRNLMTNAKSLTTPYDIHATLEDLSNLDNLKSEKTLTTQSGTSSGNSLFLKIPRTRTCATAKIDDSWCACYDQIVTISPNSSDVQDALADVANHLNNLVKDYRECAILKPHGIVMATKLSFSHSDITDEFLRIVFQVLPGKLIFEATLFRDNMEWLVIGNVTRIDSYDDREFTCVDDSVVSKYCYCTQ